jgi:hypothetical protein
MRMWIEAIPGAGTNLPRACLLLHLSRPSTL